MKETKNYRLRSILEDRIYVFALIILSLQGLRSSMTEDELVVEVKKSFKEIEEEEIRKYKHQLHLAGFITFIVVKTSENGDKREIFYWTLTEKGRGLLALIDPRYLKNN